MSPSTIEELLETGLLMTSVPKIFLMAAFAKIGKVSCCEPVPTYPPSPPGSPVPVLSSSVLPTSSLSALPKVHYQRAKKRKCLPWSGPIARD